jgi:hypothetical protein
MPVRQAVEVAAHMEIDVEERAVDRQMPGRVAAAD